DPRVGTKAFLRRHHGLACRVVVQGCCHGKCPGMLSVLICARTSATAEWQEVSKPQMLDLVDPFPTPQAQSWCSLLKLPRLSLGCGCSPTRQIRREHLSECALCQPRAGPRLWRDTVLHRGRTAAHRTAPAPGPVRWLSYAAGPQAAAAHAAWRNCCDALPPPS